MKFKTFLFFVLLLSITSLTNAQSLKNKDHSVTQAVKKLESDSDLKNAGISFYAIDVATGEVIAELNPDLCLKPASTMKVITSAAALEVLGSNYRFETTVQYDGYIDTATHTLHGNLYIKGGGDPTLGSKYYQSTKYHQFLDDWAKAVKDLNIDTITGHIIGDATIYSWDMVPPTWSWEDFGNYFGAGPCGLSIYDNFYTLHFNTSSSIGGKTTITSIEPQIPGLTIDNQVVSAKIYDDQSYIFGTPYTYNRYINGKLPLGKTDYEVKGAIPDPAFLAAHELFVKLSENGIVILKEPTTIRLMKDIEIFKNKRTNITVTYSPSLSDIIYTLNMNSVNLFAEHFLIEVGIKKGGVNEIKSATNVMENFWATKGMDINGLSINDGSGLSHYNYVSAKQLVFILRYMQKTSNNFETFYKSLPVSGESGTLKRVCKGTVAQGKVHAKSGSIRKVRCYAGYTISNSGREIAFAALINNYNCSSSESIKKMEAIMIALVNLDL
ncbi:MAG: D-alanyl-D-alanine carboxypeptidase/D-alanyl-D-alanine-endopeptidase [Bacteroidales bacterium]|nr:D-alanyl-D-alanine carboxypeptidase/D-alanyl-D-alanine-endopeptidase [Bacteroidales bacterium]